MSDLPATETPLLAASPYDLRVGLGDKVPEADMRSALESGDVGFVHSFTTGSMVDGPGVRVVGWMAGCQFRCLYCHNPDTWKMTNGMPVTAARAVEVASQYRQSLITMKGGLTISGGEPLMQHKFVLKVFSEVKKRGIHTALDSNGFLGERLADSDFANIDLVLLDLKAFTADVHQRLTGKDNAPVHDFARRLAAAKKPIWVRFVLVPGWTDDMAEVEKIANFAASLGNVERVDVLPFHQMGRFKWEKLKLEYQLNDVQPPPRATVEAAIAKFRGVGLQAC